MACSTVLLFLFLVFESLLAFKACAAQIDEEMREVQLLQEHQLLQLSTIPRTEAMRRGPAGNHGEHLVSLAHLRRPQTASRQPVLHSTNDTQTRDGAGLTVGSAWIDRIIEMITTYTEDASETMPWLLQTTNQTQAAGEVSYTWADRLYLILTIITRVILISLLVCTGLVCYCCGIVEDLLLCCGLFSRFNERTKQYIFVFILLNIVTFLAVWQVWFLRPVLYICVVLGIFCALCSGCALVIAMELLREARATFDNGVQFLGYLDDKVDDMLDFLGLSEASSDDDVTTTCWGGRVRRAAPQAKKTAEAPKLLRPLVGERESKKKKPRAGASKTVK
mmetsp:Transcript_41462/g.82025  ORF Transcript_41462/g.82025 Transcript_41462/m.82025 type:complete len:335 (+) Transcript_41462:127-1131(+)|eukprot:CAMPEP_0172817446 /NCGR_PEP_ID=MMETSP1075-20121228/13213_1 /TAXON_ID=2916 /ORGANISM="Ceratium fusus, Strain PA161109" /LENGTH=334 /DNA_ID=CAMNT_0013657653 /DNA_START=37 /DNA_END=1041 /DNA_ORIENTATION=-